jgi:hypothetical protein
MKTGLKDMGQEGVDRIYVIEDGAYWWTLVNTVMNLCLHKRLGMS